jgi:hypothetical protein
MSRVVQHSKELLGEQGPSALGFYTSGQLFLEEYYTLGLIAHGAIGTNHVDGTPGCARRPPRLPSRSLSPATVSLAITPMSITLT